MSRLTLAPSVRKIATLSSAEFHEALSEARDDIKQFIHDQLASARVGDLADRISSRRSSASGFEVDGTASAELEAASTPRQVAPTKSALFQMAHTESQWQRRPLRLWKRTTVQHAPPSDEDEVEEVDDEDGGDDDAFPKEDTEATNGSFSGASRGHLQPLLLLRPSSFAIPEDDDTTNCDGVTPKGTRSKSMRHLYGHRKTARNRSKNYWAYTALVRFVESSYFETTTGLFVVLNALTLGVETDAKVKQAGDPLDTSLAQALHLADIFFCFIFAFELAARIGVYQGLFFKMHGCAWNILDTLAVTAQVAEQAALMFSQSLLPVQASKHLRILRMFKLFRVARILRVVRVFEELRQIVSSILNALESLAWTLLLLTVMVYVFSVLIAQAIAETLVDPDFQYSDKLVYYYGSLIRTSMTLFESIAGGLSWDDAVNPLMVQVSPLLGVMFVVYIILSVFAILNMVTAVFVEKAQRVAQEDKDTSVAVQISDLFCDDEEREGHQITWEEFSTKMDSKEMQDYFMSLNIDPSEARGLFDLLDVDGGGTVDQDEIVSGCLRLRGPAKALDLLLLMHEVQWNQNQNAMALTALQGDVARQFGEIRSFLEEIGSSVSRSSVNSNPVVKVPAITPKRIHPASTKSGVSFWSNSNA